MQRGIAAASAGLAFLSALAVTPVFAAGSAPAVIRDTQASRASIPLGNVTLPVDGDHPQPDTEIEPSIAVNPANPLNAVTSFQVDRIDSGGDAGNGYATTFDGGKTWTHGFLPGLTTHVSSDPSAFERASDAVVAFGPNNTVYANALVFDQDTNNGMPSGMAINVSSDGGKTWGPAVFLEQDQGGAPCNSQTQQVTCGGLNDKNWIVVDNGTGAGHHTGRVYVFWDRIAPMVYAYCDPDVVTSAVTGAGCDKLANWTSAPEHNDAFYTFNPGPGIGSVPLVLPDGSLGVMFENDFGAGPPAVENPPTDQPDWNPTSSQIVFAQAKGAGAVPFPAPLTFSQTAFGVAANDTTCCAEQRAGTLPTAAVDPNGRIYVAWEDGRFRSDGLNDAVFSTSTDGITWTPPARINADPTNDWTNHWNTMLDVGQDGIVHVAYRQRYEKPGVPSGRSATGLSPYVDTYYQESSDQGAHWTAPLKVNSVTTDVGYCAFSRGGCFLGDYNQLAAASNGTVYIVRDEAYASYAGEPCNCSFTSGNGHQHQYTWVAVVGPQPSTQTPDTRFVPGFVLIGLAAGAMMLARGRRRKAATSAR